MKMKTILFLTFCMLFFAGVAQAVTYTDDFEASWSSTLAPDWGYTHEVYSGPSHGGSQNSEAAVMTQRSSVDLGGGQIITPYKGSHFVEFTASSGTTSSYAVAYEPAGLVEYAFAGTPLSIMAKANTPWASMAYFDTLGQWSSYPVGGLAVENNWNGGLTRINESTGLSGVPVTKLRVGMSVGETVNLGVDRTYGWHEFAVELLPDGHKRAYVDGVLILTSSLTTYSYLEPLNFLAYYPSAANSSLYVDDIKWGTGGYEYDPPITVPEPASVLALIMAMGFVVKRIRKR